MALAVLIFSEGCDLKGEDFRSLTHCLNFSLSPKLQIAKHQYIKLIETFGLRKMRVEIFGFSRDCDRNLSSEKITSGMGL